MNTLPIFGVTGRAIWFVIANLFTLFRLTWLPLAALIAATYAMAYGVVSLSPGTTAKTILETDAYMFAVFTELFLQGLVLSVVAVHVHRIILFGERRPGVYFAFPFGRTELLYVLMGTLTYVVLILLISILAYLFYVSQMLTPRGTALVIAAFVESSAPKSQTLGSILAYAAAFIAGVILIFWAMLRLTVWPPAVVANNRLALGEALRLSKGQVFALLGLMIASSLAFYFILAIMVAIAFRTDASVLLTFDNMVLETKVENALAGTAVDPNAVVVEFGYLLIATSYTVAILSYAYKALKGIDGDVAVDQQSGEPEDDPTLHMKPMGAL